MSIIKDTFFGGAEKKAAKAQQKGIERGVEATERATAEAKASVLPLFGQARNDLQQGFQGALDVFSQSLPAQVQAFQGGNVAAQQQLLAGLPQFQNAILGGNIDYSQLQPTQVQTPDLGFFSQRLPGTNPAGIDPSSTGPMIPNAFAPGTQFQGPVQNTGGFFGGLASQNTRPFNQPVNAAPTGSINPLTGQLNTDFRAFGPDFIARGPGDTPQQQLDDPTGVSRPRNLFAIGGNF